MNLIQCPDDNKCYGYVEHGGADLRLERIDKSAVKAEVLDDVTVVWVATGKEGSRIVGWYENAEMYRKCQEFEDGTAFYFVAKATDAYRIPVGRRDFPVPRAAKEGKGRGMGQSNVWYADSNFAKAHYVPKVLEYLEKMKQKSHITGFTVQERKAMTDYPNKTDEELVKIAAAASDDGDILKALQISNQVIAQEKSHCGFFRVFRGIGLENMLCYEEAIESYKEALEYFTEDEKERGLDVDARQRISRLYRWTKKNFLAWHMEEELFKIMKEKEDKAGMADSLLEMMDMACEEEKFDQLQKLIDSYDDIRTEDLADEVAGYRRLLRKGNKE